MKQTYLVQKLRHFQRQLIYMYQHNPDRKITWIVDEEGDKGNTSLNKYLTCTTNTIRLENGKCADIKYARKRVVRS
jgi:hypothetical protein